LRRSCLKLNYDWILEEAVTQNPIPEKKTGQRGRPHKGKIRALIDRLIHYKGEVCRFADNPLVPFSNNQAERELHMVKMKKQGDRLFSLCNRRCRFPDFEIIYFRCCESLSNCFFCFT